jgi:hypothetical protein
VLAAATYLGHDPELDEHGTSYAAAAAAILELTRRATAAIGAVDRTTRMIL